MAEKMTRSEFGFLPQRLETKIDNIAIETRPDFDEIIDGHKEWDGVEGDWIYAPPQQLTTFPGGEIRELPYNSRVFSLPKTHIISFGASDKEVAYPEFFMWVLSFFFGMRLTTTDAGFLDATPIKPGLLTDFHLSRRDLPRALGLANAFWQTHRAVPRRAKWFGAAIHALFLGQSRYYLQYEQFMFLYTAMDACYALAESMYGLKAKSHSIRIPWMCDHFKMPTPQWAQRQSGRRQSVIVELRNNAIHEGLFADEPLGFALHGVGSNLNLPLEISSLICRLLIALIGGDAAPYVRSPVNTRMTYGLKLS